MIKIREFLLHLLKRVGMTLNDLPEIHITRNVRSTRLRLRIDSTQIRLTAPIFCTKKQIQNFIALSESWLVKTWQEQQEKLQSIDRTLPTRLRLFNLNQPIQIIYQRQKVSFNWNEIDKIVLISDREPEKYLKSFVITYAKTYLPLYLKQVSEQTHLSFNQCAIRQPKTRWGSCSTKKDIMLNSALVLFDQEITKYVCIHELAHTKHFDHSAKFWLEVEKHDSNYKHHRKILKHSPMPYWWD